MSVDLFPESMDSKDSPEDKLTFCSTRFRRKIREVAGLLTLLVCELPAPAATLRASLLLAVELARACRPS